MRFIDLLREPKFTSKIQQDYVLIFLHECEKNNAKFWHFLHILFWIVSVISSHIFEFDHAAKEMVKVSAYGLISYSLVCLYSIKSLNMMRYSQLIGFVLVNLACFATALSDVADGTGHRGFAAMWIFGSAFGIAILAFRSRVHIATNVFCSIILWYGLKEYPEPFLGWLAGSVIILITSTTQIIIHRIFKVHGKTSFEQQSKFTPKQIILRSIQLGSQAEKIFAPEVKNCVCICSDWRSFQPWTRTVDSSSMATTLTKYYEKQVELLDESFPLGNYFLDWIADELFVVGFETDESDIASLVASSLKFAELSLNAREIFFETYAAPVGIDIGMSLGKATVGILGPSGNSKATALGDVPGHARRLQTFAKSLRAIYGIKDRVVTSPNFSQYVAMNDRGMFEFEVKPWMDLRDVDIASIYCSSHLTKDKIKNNIVLLDAG